MTGVMYEVFEDPYCYPGTDVLRNIPGDRDAAELERFEVVATTQRASEALPRGRLNVPHYKAVHRHLFRDVYDWAGKFRTVRITKDTSTFCYPENIAAEMTKLFAELKQQRYLRRLKADAFADGAAWFLSELNAIHPFREGNGRAQVSFLALLADRAGHPLSAVALDHRAFMAAMIASFNGDLRPLIDQIRGLIP